ncbi:DUF1877 family protein [uncultured Kordia sp.]|uniref:DUF1877 family protein n=1 Tax=uncultured Kordia sp. TaxID=507699 RepID=UPI002631CBE2|nr:DUF1877 family protein [uncultured Kordia sp.]
MAIDLCLLAAPKEVENILTKAIVHQDSEYPDAVFALSSALENNFTDFGHPDWIELKKDAQDVLKYYPEEKFNSKFYLDTNRTFQMFDYLIAKREDSVRHFKDAIPFFYDGIKHATCISGQGFGLLYWDLDILRKKKSLLDAVSFEEFYEVYDAENMIAEGVYKIEQLQGKTEELRTMFTKIKQFLEHALTLKGYVLIIKC